MRATSCYRQVVSVALLVALLGGCGEHHAPTATPTATATAWKFGVMADTQWDAPDDGRNPNTVAVDIINQVNQQFIEAGVKFVVQVGDLSNSGTPLAMDTRALFAQPLYNAGVAFYPLRGNHDASPAAATEFLRVFPQTVSGLQNATPADVLSTDAVNPDRPTQPSPGKTGSTFVLGANFSSPSTSLNGLSYTFEYLNARFVLLDQFTPPDKSSNSIADQQSWIGSTLAGKDATSHAFVFTHKGLITETHADTLFGNNPALNPDAQNAFLGSLESNGVHYLLGGHDHIYQRSIIVSPEGASQVEEITCASDSSKFYIPFGNPELPGTVNNDVKYNHPPRETSLAQELYTVGFYIFTVDGPRVNGDFYSAAVTPTRLGPEYMVSTTPPLEFRKRDSFGYALNGRQFLVPQGQPYTSVRDSFADTTAEVLDGTNTGTAVDGSGRPLTQEVSTGWAPATAATGSDILTLWGMGGAPGDVPPPEVYTLSMSYDPAKEGSRAGTFGLANRDPGGTWVNAVDQNRGGAKTFVLGPWNATDTLGTYGIDPDTHTAWAVIDHGGTFAVHARISAR
jgi:hypothetical protein